MWSTEGTYTVVGNKDNSVPMAGHGSPPFLKFPSSPLLEMEIF